MSTRLRSYWRTWSAAAVGAVVVALVASQSLLGGVASAAPAAAHSVRPSAVGLLDCNGYSTIQRALTRTLACTDIRGFERNAAEYHHRFYDNGHYIGHDEPSIRFLSSRPGSGNDVTLPNASRSTRRPGRR